MSTFVDCFDKISAKGYKHRDGTAVLTKGDRRTMANEIAERVKVGEDPTQAAIAAAQRLISEADAQMEDIFAQVGQPMYSTFEQVFGQKEVGDVKPVRRMADARSVVKQSYFDGAAPVTPENTAAALALAYEWQDPATGRDVAQRLIDAAAASGQETSDLMFGTAQGELHTYALKMARAGDTRLLSMMDLTSNRWEVTGRNESIGFSDIGAILAGRRAYSPNAVNAAMKEVGRARRKAATANMPEGMVDAVEETVLNTKLEESPTRQVKRTVKDAKGKTLEEKVEENVADKTAGSLLDRFATSQSDTLSWAPKGKENAIRALVRRALTLGPNAIMWDRVWMIQSLTDLGVTPELANQLTAVVAAERKRIVDIHLLKMRERQAAAEQRALEGKDRRAAAERERQLRANEITANSLIAQLAETQSDTPTDRPKPDPNAVRLLVKQIMDPNTAMDQSAIPAMVAELLKLNVDQRTAEKLTGIAWEQRKRNIANLVAIDQQKAQAAAEALIDQIPRTPTERNQTTTNADKVRAMVKQVMDPNVAMDAVAVQPVLVEEIVKLNVNRRTAEQLAQIAIEQRQKNVDAALGRYTQRQETKAQGLAEGEVGSLRGLEDALLSVPASQQYDPTWRYNTAVEYFSQLGLTPKQAESAARLYSNEFGARLADAQANAIERLSESKAPWVKELAKKPLEQRKKALSDLDKLIRAVRAGVTDPDTIWYNAVAHANGWRGFTHAQHARLGEIDELLSDPTVADYKKNALKTEVQDIVQRANLPPTIGDYVAASYAMSALSGLPTLFVQYSAPFSIARDYLIDLHTNPVVATRALLAAIDSLYNEALYAGKNDVYNHEVSENMKGELPALKDLFERGLKNLQSPNALVRARAYGQLFIGGQVFISRVLSSIDEGAIAASNIYKLSMFTQRELKALGWTRAQAGEVVVAALDTRNDSIGNLIASGMERNEATVAGNEKFRRTVYQALAAESPSMAEDVLRGSIMESFGMTGRRNDIGDVFGVKMDKVLDTEEGFLRWAVGMPKLLDMVKQWRAMGGWHSLMANLVFGFMVIPMRTAMWGSNFFGYGLIRYAIHKGRKAADKETFWKQSFGTRAQERQRLREALTSLAVMGASLALRSNSGDDDENETGFKFFITGKGPEDRVMKEAWMRQGFRPYSLVFKVGTAKFPVNLGRIGESLAWTFGVAGVLDDITLKEKGKAARSKSLASYPMEFIGGYMGSLAARSAFQGVGRTWGLFDSRKSGDKITDEVMRQAAFSASSFAPWKGAMGSMTRLVTTPVDNNTMAGVILSNMPVVGPVFGRPALNVLGDPIGDNTLSGKLYREGLPLIIRFPQDGPGARVYDLILEQGRGPSDPRQGEVEDRFGAITPEQFYNYSKERGRIIKEEMNTQYDRLRTLDPKRFGDALERITRRANRRAAQAAGLSRSGGGA